VNIATAFDVVTIRDVPLGTITQDRSEADSPE